MMKKKQSKVLTRAALILPLAIVGSASTVADPSGITVTPSIGYAEIDDDRGADFDDSFWSVGLGYRFDNPWQVELVYGQSEVSDGDVPTGDLDVESLRLDALYHLTEDKSIVPYLAIGSGYTDFDADDASGAPFDGDETNVNAGAGVKYRVNDMFSVRSDFRGIYGLAEENVDLALSLGLQMLFGGEKSPTPAPVSVPAAPVDGDADGDGDGVADSVDQCPQTKPGVQVDAKGCELDDDKDGVPNSEDECPGSEVGAKVDSVGCYIILEESRSIELKINFATNSSVIESDYLDEIQEVSDFMREYPQTSVVIEGHTDDRGQASYNQQLSEKRARNVAATLVNRFGVATDRVTSVGYGEARPTASNASAEGRAANRRVVAVISATVQKRAE